MVVDGPWDEAYVDDVDGQLLEARVYSGWKGHGKDAETAYQKVIDEHGDDFRGYLAKGVFMREIGKPDQVGGRRGVLRVCSHTTYKKKKKFTRSHVHTPQP